MRLEPKAPPLLRNRAAAVFAALGLLVPTLAVSLVFVALAGTASAVEPQPDAAPQAPAVAPDPAPEATNSAPPQQSTPQPSTQVTPQAPAAAQEPAAPAATPSTTPTPQASPKPKAERKTKPARRETSASRPEAQAEAGGPESVAASRLIPPRRAGRRGLTVAPRAARRSGPAGAADGQRLAPVGGHPRVAEAAAMKRLVLAVAATLALAGVGASAAPSRIGHCRTATPRATAMAARWYPRRGHLSWTGQRDLDRPAGTA